MEISTKLFDMVVASFISSVVFCFGRGGALNVYQILSLELGYGV